MRIVKFLNSILRLYSCYIMTLYKSQKLYSNAVAAPHNVSRLHVSVKASRLRSFHMKCFIMEGLIWSKKSATCWRWWAAGGELQLLSQGSHSLRQLHHASLLAPHWSFVWKPGYEGIPLENFWIFSQGGFRESLYFSVYVCLCVGYQDRVWPCWIRWIRSFTYLSVASYSAMLRDLILLR